MIQNLTFLAVIQLALSIFIGVFFMWLTYKLFMRWMNKRYKPDGINSAVGTLLSAVLFSTGYILSGTLAPLLSTLRIISKNNPSTGEVLIGSLQYLSEFLVLGFLVAVLVNYVSIVLFNALTPEKDEMQEISENKIQFALILSAILIVMSLFAREAFTALIDSMVPLPEMPRVY